MLHYCHGLIRALDKKHALIAQSVHRVLLRDETTHIVFYKQVVSSTGNNIFKKIYNEYTEREMGFQNIIRAYLIELIIKIFREIDKRQPAFTQSHRELVQKAIDHMRNNYKSHISLDDIVSGMFLSKNYFRQIFKKTTGTSISSYIQELRITEACRLLETTTESLAEIAVKCGFNDIKFFYQTFKKAVGMTPAEYRRQKLQKEQ